MKQSSTCSASLTESTKPSRMLIDKEPAASKLSSTCSGRMVSKCPSKMQQHPLISRWRTPQLRKWKWFTLIHLTIRPVLIVIQGNSCSIQGLLSQWAKCRKHQVSWIQRTVIQKNYKYSWHLKKAKFFSSSNLSKRWSQGRPMLSSTKLRSSVPWSKSSKMKFSTEPRRSCKKLRSRPLSSIHKRNSCRSKPI